MDNALTNSMPKYNYTTTTQTSTSNNMLDLISSIVKLLAQVVTNTAQLNEIVRLLGEYLDAVSQSSTVTINENLNMTGSGSNTSNNDPKNTAILAKQNLINAMQNNSQHNVHSAELQRLIEKAESIARA